jgi:GTP-binding protein
MPADPEARFLTSANRPEQFLPDDGAEVAFAGRSNCGKSSAINVILRRRGLARTSRTPGRTQLVNFFGVGPRRRVVDLPGYGFARVPLAVKAEWRHLVEGYLRGQRPLRGVLVLVDLRRGLQPDDQQLLDFLAALGLPAGIIATKSDKLGRGARMTALAQLTTAAAGAGAPIAFSAVTGEGADAVWDLIGEWVAG